VNLSSGEDNEDNGRTTRPILADEVVQALIPFIAGGHRGMERLAKSLMRLNFPRPLASTR
jgi:hypothetical protein